MHRVFVAKVVGSVLLGLMLLSGSGSSAGEKKKDPVRKGKVIGVLVAKGKNFIEVKADGEEKARKYVPHWKGGLPKDGGGLDKAMLKKFAELKVGSRLELTWEFEERLRAVEIKVLKK